MAAREAILVATALFTMCAGNAFAADNGDNVLVIDVAKVSIPKTIPGACRVSGVVTQVRSGWAFRTGQTISIAVPCGAQVHRDDGPAISSNSPIFQDIETLKMSKTGFVHLTDAGDLIWQATKQSYGTMGLWDMRRVIACLMVFRCR